MLEKMGFIGVVLPKNIRQKLFLIFKNAYLLKELQ